LSFFFKANSIIFCILRVWFLYIFPFAFSVAIGERIFSSGRYACGCSTHFLYPYIHLGDSTSYNRPKQFQDKMFSFFNRFFNRIVAHLTNVRIFKTSSEIHFCVFQVLKNFKTSKKESKSELK
jgi:hypothetical protein